MLQTIGLVLLDHIPLGIDRVPAPGRHCAHAALARRGACVWASPRDLSCPLARFNLGIEAPTDAVQDALAETLFEWGYAPDVTAARLFVAGLTPLPQGNRIIVYGPVEALPRDPDVTLHVVTPRLAMERIIRRLTEGALRATGDMSGAGAFCGECTAFPLQSGRIALSVGCPGSRRELMLDEAELMFAVPRAVATEIPLDVI